MKKIKKVVIAVLIVGSGMFFSSCTALQTAPYDQYSYQKSVEIKVEASRLMDKATLPYSDHLEEIESLSLEIEKIVAYEKNKPNNGITYTMWQILSDEEKNLLSGFFKRWKEKETLSGIFVTEAKAQVMEAMDLLIRYEGQKDKEAKEKLLDLIANN
ncbi:hypothetical protein POV27_18395 [Aureisphaera galaxeae]|uniref:hypothetical protein n=1 Tax=Aureisphaera galaxeae TaxID=1538023 RepID=UPI00234FF7FF|nr:hypothetical protein [Aureisphaera galaxeae]MDC8006028.1 hypothetical protein [Aureisphaera galaxeae]